MAPTAVGVRDAREYVERLASLRIWAGRPSFRRLAALAGTMTTPSGHTVDRLPPSTASDTLNGRRLPNLPRMELVEAFVTACLKACRQPEDAIDAAVGHWLAEWRRLAGLTDAVPTSSPTAPPGPRPAGRSAAEQTVGQTAGQSPWPAGAPGAERRLVGRDDALRVIDEALDGLGDGGPRIVAVAGEPGAGKTRLLDELAAGAARRGLAGARGRAGEFEQGMPLGVFADALNDHLDGTAGPCWRDRLGEDTVRSLAAVFPALAVGEPALAGPPASEEDGGAARYRLYAAVRRLIEEMAGPSGLVLILDDLHWADEASAELVHHLLRHPPRARVLVAAAYRPAQTAPRLAALLESTAGDQRVVARPLTLAETGEFLGEGVGPDECRALHAASGGNPFYLDALVRMGGTTAGGEDPARDGELPAAVRLALRVEFDRLSPRALRVAEAAAVVADEFEPATVSAAAHLDEDAVLEALDELAACDLVRPAAGGRSFRFRHPLVRGAAYQSAAPGRRLAAHGRVARHLAERGVPATVRAHHLERSARFGDEDAVATLAEAARTVAPQAPAAAAHWLAAALQLLPHTPAGDEVRRGLLVDLAQTRLVSGRLAESREAAWQALRLLPVRDHIRRGRAVQVYALAERLLGRPEESRAMLLAWLRQMPEHEAAASVPVRARLVAESLYRGDFRAAQSFLDALPGPSDDWEPSLRTIVVALRPMPAFAAGRIDEAVRQIEDADRLLAAMPDDQVARWIDLFTWMSWTDLFMGRYDSALRRIDRVLAIARSTGQDHAIAMILSGQARAYVMLGRLADGRAIAAEAMDSAELVGSRQLLAIAMAHACIAASWSGDGAAAVRLGERVVELAGSAEEWWGALAWHVRGLALINAGRVDEGAESLVHACFGYDRPRLDPFSLLSSCELMAYVEASRDRLDEAERWADRAGRVARPGLQNNTGLAVLARAYVLRRKDPVRAAEHALRAAEAFAAVGQRVDGGRARLAAGAAHREAGEGEPARRQFGRAAEIFSECGARGLRDRTLRELRGGGHGRRHG